MGGCKSWSEAQGVGVSGLASSHVLRVRGDICAVACHHENTSLDANEISHWHTMIYSIGSLAIGDHVFHWQNSFSKMFLVNPTKS